MEAVDESQEPEQLGLIELTPEQRREEELTVLAFNLSSAKEAEARTKAHRIEIEELIANLIPGDESGQVTRNLLNGTKIVVKRGFNYRADLAGVNDALARYDLPTPIETKTTHSLDVVGYEWFKRNHPDAFRQIAEHVVVTPKKVAVTIKKAK